MALQTSGAISLNEIHIEAGGSSGTAVSINDADIRALIGKNDSAAMSFNEWYGASAVTSAVEVQPAAKYQLISGPRGYSYEAFLHGFGQTYNNTYDSTIGGYNSNVTSAVKTDSAQGSIISSPDLSLWGPASGSFGTLRSITHFSRGATQAIDVVVMIVESTGSNSNAGFTNLVATRSGMTTLTLSRSSATYYYSSSNTTRIWLWDDPNYTTGTAQPFTYSHDSSLFPGGAGSGSANTSTSSRTTWTVS
tara:strand:- start:1359 stop:2105 length:747 start_codon:yes stop_codon:yes gene_type:complete